MSSRNIIYNSWSISHNLSTIRKWSSTLNYSTIIWEVSDLVDLLWNLNFNTPPPPSFPRFQIKTGSQRSFSEDVSTEVKNCCDRATGKILPKVKIKLMQLPLQVKKKGRLIYSGKAFETKEKCTLHTYHQ